MMEAAMVFGMLLLGVCSVIVTVINVLGVMSCWLVRVRGMYRFAPMMKVLCRRCFRCRRVRRVTSCGRAGLGIRRRV